MSVETLNNQTEDLIQESLFELKNQINKPGQVNYIKESKDKKYDIYSYKLVQGGTKGGIKNKYINQIGSRIEGTQFTDVNGNELKKERFDAGEIVYLRVPKKKETNNQKENKGTPGKVEYIGNRTDKENRNRKWYSYAFEKGGNLGGVDIKKRPRDSRDDLGYYCDKNGNRLKKERYNKGETIYYKAPNTDIIDSIPEMSYDDIMKLSNRQIERILEDCIQDRISRIEHKDKNGHYNIINGKKLYSYYRDSTTKAKAFFFVEAHETVSNVESISIFIKEGKKIRGVVANYGSEKLEIYRGNLKLDSDGFPMPENM